MSQDTRPVNARAMVLGAMFLMATSAIGPGFITQTTTFTARLGAAFAFAILVSTLVDAAVQLNVWRVIGVSRLRAHELGNRVAPGAGWVLTVLVVVGGFIFNIANVAGAGLGMNAMFGMDARIGGAISAALAVALFCIKRAGAALDRVVVVLGFVMILLTAYVAIVSGPPVGDALRRHGAAGPDRLHRDHDADRRHGRRVHHLRRRAPARRLRHDRARSTPARSAAARCSASSSRR